MSTDPEVAELTDRIRHLTAHAQDLVQGITATLDELVEFAEDVAELDQRFVERRSPNPAPYHGVERRRGH